MFSRNMPAPQFEQLVDGEDEADGRAEEEKIAAMLPVGFFPLPLLDAEQAIKVPADLAAA